ncbi:MAG: hypothetical protein WBB43_20430 [Limnoraphis sp.]|jgi:hypothetical protein
MSDLQNTQVNIGDILKGIATFDPKNQGLLIDKLASDQKYRIVASTMNNIAHLCFEYASLVEFEKTKQREIERKEKETIETIRFLSDNIGKVVAENRATKKQAIDNIDKVMASIDERLMPVITATGNEKIIEVYLNFHSKALDNIVEVVKAPSGDLQALADAYKNVSRNQTADQNTVDIEYKSAAPDDD